MKNLSKLYESATCHSKFKYITQRMISILIYMSFLKSFRYQIKQITGFLVILILTNCNWQLSSNGHIYTAATAILVLQLQLQYVMWARNHLVQGIGAKVARAYHAPELLAVARERLCDQKRPREM